MTAAALATSQPAAPPLLAAGIAEKVSDAESELRALEAQVGDAALDRFQTARAVLAGVTISPSDFGEKS